MQIIRLDPQDHQQVHRFIDFPFKLYRDSPQWVPPLVGDMYAIFDRKRHPFYEHSDADFFLVQTEKEVLGRIAVLHNRNFCQHHNLDLGFFYFFDAVEDEQAAKLLIDAAAEWASSRRLKGIYGAKGFSRADGQGVLVEGFEHRALFGAPYNYAYYDRLLTAGGMHKHTDFLSGYMVRGMEYPARMMEAAEKARERGGFTIQRFTNKHEMRKWIPALGKVNHEAFSGNPGFIPSSDKELKKIAESILLIADPRMILLILKDEEVVGFILAYPEVGRAVQRQRGQLWPFSWIDILLEKKRASTIILNGIGILPRFQGFGANIMLHAELTRILLANRQVQRVEMNQVDENNYRSRTDLEKIGTVFYKRHRMYVLPLVPESELLLPKQWKLSGGE